MNVPPIVAKLQNFVFQLTRVLTACLNEVNTPEVCVDGIV
jgi:hypothetical protein